MKPLSILFFLSFSLSTALVSELQYPETPKRPVQNNYHGIEVVDDYRWLEDASAPEVNHWSLAQNETTQHYLESLVGTDKNSRRSDIDHGK